MSRLLLTVAVLVILSLIYVDARTLSSANTLDASFLSIESEAPVKTFGACEFKGQKGVCQLKGTCTGTALSGTGLCKTNTAARCCVPKAKPAPKPLKQANPTTTAATGTSFRAAAARIAESSLHIREKGGNNRGKEVDAIIKANSGDIGEKWCGDFMAWCYRKGGSKRPNRAWAGAWNTANQPGVKKTTTPQKGDLVIFTFSHIGMFIRDLGNGKVETIEGNTGPSGSRSDNSAGGDGVHRRTRAKSEIKGFYTVTEK